MKKFEPTIIEGGKTGLKKSDPVVIEKPKPRAPKKQPENAAIVTLEKILDAARKGYVQAVGIAFVCDDMTVGDCWGMPATGCEYDHALITATAVMFDSLKDNLQVVDTEDSEVDPSEDFL